MIGTSLRIGIGMVVSDVLHSFHPVSVFEVCPVLVSVYVFHSQFTY